jgi:hypothetical protein
VETAALVLLLSDTQYKDKIWRTTQKY